MATMHVPALSLQHHRTNFERTVGPIVKLVEMLSTSDPAKLEEVRRRFEALTAEYYDDNVVSQGYLITRAIKN